MIYKNELQDYCDAIRRILNSQFSDAMQRAFLAWIDVLPEKNMGIVAPTESPEYPQQAYLLRFAPGVEIGFSIPNLLDQYDHGRLNVSRVCATSTNDIIFSKEVAEPFMQDDSSIMAVKFPVGISDLRTLKDYIVDGNKRISSMLRSESIQSISYNRVEPHSLTPWCFTDVYSHFILLYTYDMVLSVVHNDPMGVLFRIGAETIPGLTKYYPKFLEDLASNSSS